MFNENKTYAIVNKKRKVIEYFRTKTTALFKLPSVQKDYQDKLRIVRLK